MEKLERVQKVIANAGVTSRRHAENLIVAGKVTVNGQTITELGVKVSAKDKIEVNGEPIVSGEKKVYFLLNKPRNTVTTNKDEKRRATVLDLFSNISERIYPVGRLDYDTTGALLLTNDGDLANQLMHPKFQVNKVYIAKVTGIATDQQIDKLTQGVKIDGKMTAKAKANIDHVDRTKQKTWVKLTIHEGRNHQVKNMLKAVGLNVEKLKREQYGFLDLTGLQPGEYRRLKQDEVKKLKAID